MKDNLKIEDDLRNAEWKTTKKGSKWEKNKMKMTKKIQLNATTTKIKNILNQYKFKNKIVQIGCGSAPGNLV